MAPFRASRSTRSGRPGGQSDHDIFDGLPVRQWRLRDTALAPGHEVNGEIAKPDAPQAGQPELPMPKGSESYKPYCIQLLKAARAGKFLRPADTTANGVVYHKDNESATQDKAPVEPSKTVKRSAQQAFVATKWTQVPKNLEEAEPEYLAKRRKGLDRSSAAKAVSFAATVDTAHMRKTKVRKEDEGGQAQILEVMVPEGRIVEGEIKEEVALDATAPPVAVPAPGTIIQGLGVANEEGVVVATEALMPMKRKPGPIRRKKKPKGRRKMTETAGTGVSASAEALNQLVETNKHEDGDAEGQSDTRMTGTKEGEEDDDDDDDDEDGSEEEDDDDNEGDEEHSRTDGNPTSDPNIRAIHESTNGITPSAQEETPLPVEPEGPGADTPHEFTHSTIEQAQGVPDVHSTQGSEQPQQVPMSDVQSAYTAAPAENQFPSQLVPPAEPTVESPPPPAVIPGTSSNLPVTISEALPTTAIDQEPIIAPVDPIPETLNAAPTEPVPIPAMLDPQPEPMLLAEQTTAPAVMPIEPPVEPTIPPTPTEPPPPPPPPPAAAEQMPMQVRLQGTEQAQPEEDSMSDSPPRPSPEPLSPPPQSPLSIPPDSPTQATSDAGPAISGPTVNTDVATQAVAPPVLDLEESTKTQPAPSDTSSRPPKAIEALLNPPLEEVQQQSSAGPSTLASTQPASTNPPPVQSAMPNILNPVEEEAEQQQKS